MKSNHIYHGDTLKILKTFPDEFVDTIVTSPPYWGLRDYGVEGQIGLEPTLEGYLGKLLAITAELKRVLKPTGVLWWNHGDAYASGGTRRFDPHKYGGKSGIHCGRARTKDYQQKCMLLQNYRLILRMIDEQGWILRNSIIWHKPNAMPSSVKDRFSNSYEPIFMLVKKRKYWFDLDAVRAPHKVASIERAKYPINPYGDQGTGSRAKMTGSLKGGGKRKMITLPAGGKNPGDLWRIPTQPFPEAHFATFPEKLVEPMVKSSCPQWVCKKCGEARERIVEVDRSRCEITHWDELEDNLSKKVQENLDKDLHQRKNISGIFKYAIGARRITKGWTNCSCNAGWRKGIVLDPFMGSGTTAVVARKLGRNWIGIELNREYIKIAEKRLAQQVLL